MCMCLFFILPISKTQTLELRLLDTVQEKASSCVKKKSATVTVNSGFVYLCGAKKKCGFPLQKKTLF